jgi:cytochrome c oxidase subunit 4
MSKDPIPTITRLAAVWLALLALLALTTGSAFIAMGSMNLAVNLLIAFAEVFLMVTFFMHLQHRSGLLRAVASAGLLWLTLLILLTAADYLTRVPLSAPW